ncbi:MAG: hypothetical protein AABY92_05090, partial [Thermodesulfobacteriota bacterium]
RIDKEAIPGRMKYLRLHPVRGTFPTSKLTAQGWVFSRKVGTEWGQIHPAKKKGSRYFSVTP